MNRLACIVWTQLRAFSSVVGTGLATAAVRQIFPLDLKTVMPSGHQSFFKRASFVCMYSVCITCMAAIPATEVATIIFVFFTCVRNYIQQISISVPTVIQVSIPANCSCLGSNLIQLAIVCNGRDESWHAVCMQYSQRLSSLG